MSYMYVLVYFYRLIVGYTFTQGRGRWRLDDWSQSGSPVQTAQVGLE